MFAFTYNTASMVAMTKANNDDFPNDPTQGK
ncbi:hypothetical protein CGLO_04352 [Colletotrichum gloeosporioides Cg-14]|uniref:Uncharacterized protein n=1 Tax=Colletotrichum gloeosporioides (strain Cg-14) TaxID=1237896 RepID=T0KUC2_COLGC|nr:hypothetical protein CGLO_04352 [Colletotrichum gloeosporioides Cg-14]